MTGELILNATIMGVGMHLGAWRHRPEPATSYLDLEYYIAAARLAEEGRLHGVFLADTLAVSEENLERPNLGAMDPVTVLGAVAASTTNIGLIATASTSYNEPYNLARRFATLDLISKGRAGWNVSRHGPSTKPRISGWKQRWIMTRVTPVRPSSSR